MTAAAAQEVASVVVQPIRLEDLRAAEWNARKSFDPAALGELTQSIAAHGIQAPLIVRPLPASRWTTLAERDLMDGGEMLYEIVAGHRRFRAAKLLGLESVPAIVRDLDDDQAREIGLVDNLQREDVPALEEADAYEELRQRLGTPAAIAARVGKDVAWVTRRLQLVHLGAWPRAALAERLITVDHALLLAKLGAEEQEQALRWTVDKFSTTKQKTEAVLEKARKELAEGRENAYVGKYYAPQTVAALRQWIEEQTDLQLSRAPWDLADATLGGACTACPKNTAANTALFGDLAIGEASCTDSRCFNRKREAFVQITLEAVKAAGAEAVRLSWQECASTPAWVSQSNDKYLAHVFKRGHWIEAKPGSCGFLRTGVTVDFPKKHRGYMGSAEDAKRKPGQQILVCVAVGCKTHPKAWQQKKASGTSFDAKAYEEQERKRKEAALAENKLRMAAAGAAVDAVTKLPEAALRACLLSLNTSDAQNALAPGLRKTIELAPITSAVFAKAVAALSIDSLQISSCNTPEQWRKEFLASLGRLGYNASAVWAKPKAAKKAAAKKVAKPVKKAGRK